MKTNPTNLVRIAVCTISFSFFAGSLLAQDPPPGPPPDDSPQQSAPNPGGWRRVEDPPPPQANAPRPPDNPRTTMDPNYGPPQGPGQQYPNQPYPNQPYPNQAGNYDRPIPPKLTIKPGTYITVRLNQALSSDRNQAGDAFAATLIKPVVVDGVVVADRGQTVGGRVVDAKKAGRVEGVSHLGVQLTDLTLADGQPVTLQSQLISRTGPTSEGRDAAAIGTTTATGAAIGAMADWGRGAAIGAGAGAVAGIVGVLLTRGHPTILYPESVLTFRVDAPVTFSTEVAPQAFRYVSPGDYDRPYDMQARMAPQQRPAPYYYGYPYGYPYYPYWGPSLGFYWGPSFYWGRGYWGGWHGRGFRHR
ncbi:MAG: hypothetical protein U0Q18_20705 [Bryobacteraceae bacterium]